MIVQPALRYEFGEEFRSALEGTDPRTPPINLRTAVSKAEDGLFIECRGVSPSSSEGRKVWLHVPPEVADLMLKQLRDYGIERRRSIK